MGSTRLPGKVLLPLAGQPLVGHIIDRLRATPGVASVVLSTSTDAQNDPLVAFADMKGVAVHRGCGEDDIAARLAGAARLTGADAILKVNGDCPLVDPAVMARLVDRFVAGGLDYVSNKIIWSWPEGLSAELIARSALDWCDAALTAPEDRELVANWIRDRRDRFRVDSVEGDRDLTRYRLTVDTAQDYEEMSRIFSALWRRDRIFAIDSVIRFLDQAANGSNGRTRAVTSGDP